MKNDDILCRERKLHAGSTYPGVSSTRVLRRENITRENYKGAGTSRGNDSYDLSVTDQWLPAAEVTVMEAKPMCSMHEIKKTMTIEAVRGMGIKMDL